MEPVDDFPMARGPPIQLLHWRNARQQNNERIEFEQPYIQRDMNVQPRRPLNKIPVNVAIRNGVKYFHEQTHDLWFSYINDQTIGDHIQKPPEKPMMTFYDPDSDPPLDIVLINRQLFYISNDRKFYPYYATKNARVKEVPEPYWPVLRPRSQVDERIVTKVVLLNGETTTLALVLDYLVCTFEEYKGEVVWNPRNYTLHSRLPINITEFKGDNLNLTSLPPLPASLKILRCHRNQLTSLPPLPPNLEILSCGRNKLTALPPLPAGLKELSFAYNQVSGLGLLPAELQKFIGDSNPLKCLPVLPSGLYTLSCKNTQIKCVPTLPETLGFLDCSHNDLGVLPTLPEELDTLWCTNCRLTKLPEIPESLTRLDYSHNRIRGIVDFPYWVQYYKCSYNFIEGFDSFRNDTGCPCCDKAVKKRHLENLVEPVHKHHPFNFKSPRELMRFDCSHNPIKAFPDFPDELRKLNCSYTRIQSLPDLPADVHYLDCSYTPLKALPALPRHVTHLDCSSTLVRTLPELEILPFRFGSLSCYNTRLGPELMQYIDRGDLDSVNYYTFAQRHKEQLKKDVRPVLNFWIALGCDRNSEYIESEYGVLPAEISRKIAGFLSNVANNQPLAAIVAGFRTRVLEPIVRPEEVL